MFKSTLSCVTILLCLSLLWASHSDAQDKDDRLTASEKPRFDLESLDWLAGYWVGEGFGGVCEEMWSPPVAGSMVGTFKMSDGERQVSFYEIFTLTLDSAGLPQINLKHFNADMTGWEEKEEMVTFRYESDRPNEITIGAVTYRNIAPDSLHVDVVLKNKDGEVNTETIKFKRKSL